MWDAARDPVITHLSAAQYTCQYSDRCHNSYFGSTMTWKRKWNNPFQMHKMKLNGSVWWLRLLYYYINHVDLDTSLCHIWAVRYITKFSSSQRGTEFGNSLCQRATENGNVQDWYIAYGLLYNLIPLNSYNFLVPLLKMDVLFCYCYSHSWEPKS